MDILAQMGWSVFLLALMLISICGLLMLVIMIQRGRGSGLAGAFGGAGGGAGAFGAKTGDILTWITVAVAALFLLLASVANHVFDQSPDQPTRASALGAATEPEAQDTETISLPVTLPPALPADAEVGTSAADTTVEKPSTATPAGSSEVGVPTTGGPGENDAPPVNPGTAPGESKDRSIP